MLTMAQSAIPGHGLALHLIGPASALHVADRERACPVDELIVRVVVLVRRREEIRSGLRGE